MNVKIRPSDVRNRAVGMLQAGITQVNVATEFGKSIRTIKRWWLKQKRGESLEHRQGAGRPKSLCRASKIAIAKSLGKRRQSTRSLARRITASGNPVSKDTIHRHLTSVVKANPYKRAKQPKLSEFQIANRLKFCQEKKNWSVEDWRNILWSDESPFQLFQLSNHQNDRIWAKDNLNIPSQKTVKFPPKVMVWGMMSFQALSELHFLPPKQTINAAYYVEDILTKVCLTSLNRTADIGSILERKFMPNMSNAVFMQDGAPAHTAIRTQKWCRENLASFWEKKEWPGNSPDLNPIENLWAILKSKLEEKEPANNLETLKFQLKLVWSEIQPILLENLVSGMPNRIQKCIQMGGGYIGK